MRRGTSIAVALICVAAPVGCGGGDSSSSTRASTTTAAESGVTGFTGEAPTDPISYHAIADRYCRKAEHELDRAVRERFGDGEPTDEEFATFVSDVYVPVMRRQMEQIRTIPIPAGEEEKLNAIYEAFDEGIDEAEADPGALVAGPPAGIKEASRLALEYGFDDCGLDS